MTFAARIEDVNRAANRLQLTAFRPPASTSGSAASFAPSPAATLFKSPAADLGHLDRLDKMQISLLGPRDRGSINCLFPAFSGPLYGFVRLGRQPVFLVGTPLVARLTFCSVAHRVEELTMARGGRSFARHISIVETERRF